MNKIPAKKKKHKVDDDNPIVTSVMIDKASMVVDMPKDGLCDKAYEIIKGDIQQGKAGVCKTKATGKYSLAVKRLYPTKLDEILHAKCPSIHIQITNPKASKPQMRLEWNPSHVTEVGEAYLDILFEMLVGTDFYEFLAYGRFTRLDFCRNILSRPLEQYVIKSKWAKSSLCAFSSSGKLETIKLGKCGNIIITAYDKTKQMHGESMPDGSIRIEAKCLGNWTLAEVAKMLNPFERTEIYSLRCGKPPLGEAHWRAFIDSCHLRGVQNAIKRQPKKHHAALKKFLSSHPVTWWDITPDDWDWLLTDALDNAGFMNIPEFPSPLTLANGAGQAA